MSELERANTSGGGVVSPPELRLELTREGIDKVLSIYVDDPAESSDSFKLDDFLLAFRQRKRLLAIGTVLGLGLAVLVLVMSKPLYSVSSLVVIGETEPNPGGGGPGYVGAQFLGTQAEVMSSPSILAVAVANAGTPASLAVGEDALGHALDAVSASPITGTQIVSLRYLGSDDDYGVALLNTIVDVYLEQVRGDTGSRQQQGLETHDAELQRLLAEVSEREERLAALRRQNDIVGSAEAAAAVQSELLMNQLKNRTQVRNERLALQNRSGFGSAGTSEIPRSLADELWQAEAEVARLRMTLTARHPTLAAAERRLASLQAQLDHATNSSPGGFDRDIAALRGLESEYAAEERSLRSRLAAIEDYRRQENALVDELNRLRSVVAERQAEVLDRRLLTRLFSSSELGVTARVIAEPVKPKSPVWPQPKLILPGGAVLGFGCGLLAGMMSLRRARLDRTLDLVSP